MEVRKKKRPARTGRETDGLSRGTDRGSGGRSARTGRNTRRGVSRTETASDRGVPRKRRPSDGREGAAGETPAQNDIAELRARMAASRSARGRVDRRRKAAEKRRQQVLIQKAVLIAVVAALVAGVIIAAVRGSGKKGAAAGASAEPALSSLQAELSASPDQAGASGSGFSEVPALSEASPPDIPVSELLNPLAGRPDDLPDIDVSSWEFILANPTHSIADYAPEVTEVEDIRVDYRIREPLEAMVAATRNAGHSVVLSSGYRDYYTQKELFDEKAAEYGEDEAARIVAVPGTSEHQTGLAADITDTYYEQKGRSLEETGMYRYMSAHCHEYGFIVRFPDGKEDITGIMYEPWHFRYVGTEAAAYIMENGLTLEEFLAFYGVE